MERRQFIKTIVPGGVILALAGGGYVWLSGDEKPQALSIHGALQQLGTLTDSISSGGQWSPQQIFTHCAQSIEYSLAGFPQHKSAFFKHTAGRLAFSLFSAQGKMSHGLSEPIPGAPALDPNVETRSALLRLKTALVDFLNYNGEMAPHFAYGRLSKQEYELAHVMHLYNHLEEIST